MVIYIQVLTGHAENILLLSHSIFEKKILRLTALFL